MNDAPLYVDARDRQRYHRRCVIVDQAMINEATQAFYLARASQLGTNDTNQPCMEECIEKVLKAALGQGT